MRTLHLPTLAGQKHAPLLFSASRTNNGRAPSGLARSREKKPLIRFSFGPIIALKEFLKSARRVVSEFMLGGLIFGKE